MKKLKLNIECFYHYGFLKKIIYYNENQTINIIDYFNIYYNNEQQVSCLYTHFLSLKWINILKEKI